MCFCECKQHACEGQKRAQDYLSLELQVIARLLNCGPLEEQQVFYPTKPLLQTSGRKRVPKLDTKLMAKK